jgi:ABC-2 type transport system permease protein
MSIRLHALIIRIIKQILNDKRTIAIILIAPVVILTLVNFILKAEDNTYEIGVVNAKDAFVDELQSNEDNHITVKDVREEDIKDMVHEGDLDGGVVFDDDKATIYVSGVDQSVASKVEMLIKSADANINKKQLQSQLNTLNSTPSIYHGPKIEFLEGNYDVNYVAGKADGSLFDKFGTQLIGIIVFFFVFLIAGINFLGERTSGTLEKLLSTPIRRGEIVLGYLIGYSVLAILQSILVTLFSVYVLGLNVAGNLFFAILISLLTAMNALSLGILLSTIAHSEFQMMQFIPIVILPQIFLCGLFRVSGVWNNLGYVMPLRYSSHALTEVMLKGNGWMSILPDVTFLLGGSILFIAINIGLLKKQRNI